MTDRPAFPFLHGVLDQGYFCDGIYLPAEAEEYERDILRMKVLPSLPEPFRYSPMVGRAVSPIQE